MVLSFIGCKKGNLYTNSFSKKVLLLAPSSFISFRPSNEFIADILKKHK